MSDNVFAYLDPEPVPGSLAHPEAVWGQAREDYLGGDSAGEVCRRYGLSRSRFFERAKREGWRRQDRDGPGAEDRAAEAALADAEFVEAALREPATPAYGLSRRAWAMAERAILTGRRMEAAGWLRMARDLRRMAMDEAGALSWSTTVKRCEPSSCAPELSPGVSLPTLAAEAPLDPKGEPAQPSASYRPDRSARAPDSSPPAAQTPPTGTGPPLPAPDAVLASPRKLAQWLEQEFGPGVRALGLPGVGLPDLGLPDLGPPDLGSPDLAPGQPDSPDRSGPAADSPG